MLLTEMQKRLFDKIKPRFKKAAEDARKLYESDERWAVDIAECVTSRALDTDFLDKNIKVCVQSSLAPRDADGIF